MLKNNWWTRQPANLEDNSVRLGSKRLTFELSSGSNLLHYVAATQLLHSALHYLLNTTTQTICSAVVKVVQFDLSSRLPVFPLSRHRSTQSITLRRWYSTVREVNEVKDQTT